MPVVTLVSHTVEEEYILRYFKDLWDRRSTLPPNLLHSTLKALSESTMSELEELSAELKAKQ